MNLLKQKKRIFKLMVFCNFPRPGRPVHCIICPNNPGQKPGEKSGQKSGQHFGQNSARGGCLLTGGAGYLVYGSFM